MYSVLRKVAVKAYKYNKYTPHQGKKECERRLKKGLEVEI